MKAVLTYDGVAVRTTNLIDPKFNFWGVLSGFTYDKDGQRKTYRLLQPSAFRTDMGAVYNSDRRTDYFDVEFYAKHMNKPHGYTLESLLAKHTFDKGEFVRAKEDDEVVLSRANFDATKPFYTADIYKALHEEGVLYQDGLDIDLSLLGTPQTKTATQSEYGAGFFSKHIGEIQNVAEEDKPEFAELVVRSALRINMIVRDIFPLIPVSREQTPHWAFADNLKDNLKSRWKHNKLSTSVNLPEIREYYEGLTQFYAAFFQNQDYLANERLAAKLLLIDIMPMSALKELLTTDDKIEFLKSMIKNGYFTGTLKERDERVIGRIINSVKIDDPNDEVQNAQNADKFLDFLLEKRDGQLTYFGTLYSMVTDDEGAMSLSSSGSWISDIEWFQEELSNRKVFVFGIFNIWKKSKYNFYGTPADGSSLNDDEINPQNYWQQQGQGFFENGNPVLEYSYKGDYFLSHEVKYRAKTGVQLTNITINKVNLTSELRENINYGSTLDLSSHHRINYSSEQEHGTYHIFQPLAILGFKDDYNIGVPEFSVIPAFLLYYTSDFEKIRGINAAIDLAVDVAIEAALLLFTGGVSTFANLRHLRHFRHLKHVTRFGKAYNRSLNSSELVYTYNSLQGLAAGLEGIDVTASVLESFADYVAATNPQDEFAQKLSNFFFYLSIGAMGSGAILSSQKAGLLAEDIVDDLDSPNPPNIPSGLQDAMDEIEDVVRAVATYSKDSFTAFVAKIETLDLAGETNHILDKFTTSLTIQQKIEFWLDFMHVDVNDLAFWRRLNLDTAERIEMWKVVPDRFKPYRSNIKFLDEIYKLKKSDRKAYEHLAKFDNRPSPGQGENTYNPTGGHLEDLVLDGNMEHFSTQNGIEILDPKYPHVINDDNTNQLMQDYLDATENNLEGGYRKTQKQNGHSIHEFLYTKVKPQPDPVDIEEETRQGRAVLNGVVYKKKKKHTQINPTWDEERVIHEFAYALMNKAMPRLRNSLDPSISRQLNALDRKFGVSDKRWEETVYSSKLLDGTEVEIIHLNFHRYNQSPATLTEDHYSSFELTL